MKKSNSEAIDILISMAPEENRTEVAKLLKSHDKFNKPDDPVFQIMLQLAIYQKFQNRFPGELKEAADEIKHCTQSFLKGVKIMAKVQEHVKNTYIYFSIFLLISLFLVVMYSFTLDRKFEKYITIQEQYSSELEKDKKEEEKGDYHIVLPEYFRKK